MWIHTMKQMTKHSKTREGVEILRTLHKEGKDLFFEYSNGTFDTPKTFNYHTILHAIFSQQ